MQERGEALVARAVAAQCRGRGFVEYTRDVNLPLRMRTGLARVSFVGGVKFKRAEIALCNRLALAIPAAVHDDITVGAGLI